MKRFVTTIIIFAMTWGLFSAYWFFVQSKIESGYIDVQRDFAQEGLSLSGNVPEISGYPFKFLTKLDRFSFENPYGISVETKNLDFRSSSLKPTHWTVESQSISRVKLGSVSIFDLKPKFLKASLGTKLNGTVDEIRLNAQGITLIPISGIVPPVQSLNTMRVDIHPAGGGLDFAILAQDLTLTGENIAIAEQMFGPNISVMNITAHAGGLRGLDQNSLTAWQHTGTLRIDESAILWGTADIAVQANLQLSPHGPSGEIRLKLGNPEKLLHTLTTSGLISAQHAMGLTFAVKAAPKSEDGKIEIAFPVKDGNVLFLGQSITKIPAFNF